MKFKEIRTTFQQFAVSLDQLVSLTGLDVNEAQAKSLYKHLSHYPIETINQVFQWYVYRQDNHTPWDFLRVITKQCKDTFYHPSTITVDGVEMGLRNINNGVPQYLPAVNLTINQIETDNKNHRRDGTKSIIAIKNEKRIEKRTLSEYAEGIVKGTEPPATDKQNAARQIADLKEQYKV